MKARSPDFNVAGQQSAVGQNDMVAQNDVVPDVGIDHQKIVRADDGGLAHFGRAMHRGAFAHQIVVAHAQFGRFILVFDILRGLAHDAPGVKAVVGADARMAGQINVRPDAAARPHGNMPVDHGVRPDLNARVQLRFRMNYGGGMNHFCFTR